MTEPVSFKDRVCRAAIQYAQDYKSYYADKSYLLISDAFHKQQYYIVEAERDNYLHLLGVSTNLSASSFFDKCYDSILSADDFEILFHGKDKKTSKGSIRRKIQTIPHIFNLFSAPNYVEEDFRKNLVYCSMASSNQLCTLGFVATPSARPKTLQKGNTLDTAKSAPLKIVLSKSRHDEKFSDILVGSEEDLAACYDNIKDYLSADLIHRIKSLPPQDEPVCNKALQKSSEDLPSDEKPSIIADLKKYQEELATKNEGKTPNKHRTEPEL